MKVIDLDEIEALKEKFADDRAYSKVRKYDYI